MSTENKFIEVTRITFNRELQKNIFLKETYNVADIKTFRRWFKNEKHADVEGEITMLIVGSPDISGKEAEAEDEKKPEKTYRQVLIHESYNDWLKRINNVSPVAQ